MFFLILYLALLAYLLTWSMKDARLRGKSPLLVCLAVLISFPLGLILWLLLRPEIQEANKEPREFHLDDFRVQ
jgi:hypothetical protein